MQNVTDYENDFLDTLKDSEEKIKVYVVNGVCLEGTLLSYNSKSISIFGKLGTQIIYKSSIISISKKQYIENYEE